LIAIVDAGPLYAAVDVAEPDHLTCAQLLQSGDFDLVIPTLVVAEVCHFIGTRLSASLEATFLRGLQLVEVEAPTAEDWDAIAELVERYSDFPLGTTDASIVVLAERLGTDVILTLDQRHFRAVRMRNGRPFRLLPD
jgi:predicted nucleic acid-binding protein